MRLAEAEALPVCVEALVEPVEASARSEPFFARLVDETLAHAPISGIVLRCVLNRLAKAAPQRDLTFVGNDASAGLIVALADTMAWSRQLREEVLQCQMDAVGSVDVSVMVHLMDVQLGLQVLLREAIEVHAKLHAASEQEG